MASDSVKRRKRAARRAERDAAEAAAAAPAPRAAAPSPAVAARAVPSPKPRVPVQSVTDRIYGISHMEAAKAQLARASDAVQQRASPRTLLPKHVDAPAPLAPDVVASARTKPPAKFARPPAGKPLDMRKPGPCKARPTDSASKGGGSKSFAPWKDTKYCRT